MTQRDDKQRMRTSREELGKFFYELAKMAFGAMVLAGGVGIVTHSGDVNAWSILLVVGVFATVLFASVGNKVLKKK